MARYIASFQVSSIEWLEPCQRAHVGTLRGGIYLWVFWQVKLCKTCHWAHLFTAVLNNSKTTIAKQWTAKHHRMFMYTWKSLRFNNNHLIWAHKMMLRIETNWIIKKTVEIDLFFFLLFTIGNHYIQISNH